MKTSEHHDLSRTDDFVALSELSCGALPFFRPFLYTAAALFLALLVPTVFFLSIGFGLWQPPAETDSWGRMFGLLSGLVLLIMSLAACGSLILLLSYRHRTSFAAARPWPILLSAAVSLLIAAAFVGLIVGLFGWHPLFVVLAVLFLVHGMFGMFLVFRPLRSVLPDRGDMDNTHVDGDNEGAAAGDIFDAAETVSGAGRSQEEGQAWLDAGVAAKAAAPADGDENGADGGEN